MDPTARCGPVPRGRLGGQPQAARPPDAPIRAPFAPAHFEGVVRYPSHMERTHLPRMRGVTRLHGAGRGACPHVQARPGGIRVIHGARASEPCAYRSARGSAGLEPKNRFIAHPILHTPYRIPHGVRYHRSARVWRRIPVPQARWSRRSRRRSWRPAGPPARPLRAPPPAPAPTRVCRCGPARPRGVGDTYRPCVAARRREAGRGARGHGEE